MKTTVSYGMLFSILWEAKAQTKKDIEQFDLNYDKELLIKIDDLIKVINESDAYEFVIEDNKPF